MSDSLTVYLACMNGGGLFDPPRLSSGSTHNDDYISFVLFLTGFSARLFACVCLCLFACVCLCLFACVCLFTCLFASSFVFSVFSGRGLTKSILKQNSFVKSRLIHFLPR